MRLPSEDSEASSHPRTDDAQTLAAVRCCCADVALVPASTHLLRVRCEGVPLVSAPIRTRPTRKVTDALARDRLRAAQAAETRAVANVLAAEAKVAVAIAKREKAYAAADTWVAAANTVLDAARTELASVSGVDRAAALLGITKPELRKSLGTTSGSGNATTRTGDRP